MVLEIIYQDEDLIAINKPYGYFVHKSSLDATSSKILMKILKKQIGQMVYPVHRLDRKTTGVLLFALNQPILAQVNKLFEDRQTYKEYTAICRGWLADSGQIDYDLLHETTLLPQTAVTNFEVLEKVEADLPSGKFQTTRYSLVKFLPQTGRMHQIRKHAAHIFHPIIGDRPHGCNKQNKLLLDRFEYIEMALHANKFSMKLPDQESIEIEASFSAEFIRIGSLLGFRSIPQ
jgi:tRNA pseudouridine65 synthase